MLYKIRYTPEASIDLASITKKHRLVYEIRDTEVIVLVLTAFGYYDDK